MLPVQLDLFLFFVGIVSCASTLSTEETALVSNLTNSYESENFYAISFVDGSEAEKYFVPDFDVKPKGLGDKLLKRWHTSYSSNIQMNFQSSYSSGSSHVSYRSSYSFTSSYSSTHNPPPPPRTPDCGGSCQAPSINVFLSHPSICYAAAYGGGCYYNRVTGVAAFQAPVINYGQIQRADCELAQARCVYGYSGSFVPLNGCVQYIV